MPDITQASDFYLSDVSPKDKPWDVHRATADLVQRLYAGSDLQRYADRIQQCSKLLGFALQAQDSGDLKLKLRVCNTCHVRHCPVCQWRRSLVWRARFFEAIPRVREDYPKARWVFLTLTVRNCPLTALRDTLQAMNKGWERLTKLKAFPALGFVKSVEVTRNPETGEAHPHFHCLLVVPSSYFGQRYLKHEDWVRLWQQSMRLDYTPVVNVKTVKPKPGTDGDGLTESVLEVLKYGIKESDLTFSAEWLHELTIQLHKTRAVSVGGILRTYLSDSEPEDLINVAGTDEDEPTDEDLRVWFGWREMVKRYAKISR